LSAEGIPNLAPFSFFNVVCAKPPTVVFCPMLSGPEAIKKDTVRNIEATKEFVIQVVSRDLADKMNLTSCELASDIDEFEVANLTAVPSRTVKPPRVAEAKAHIECRLQQIVPVGEGTGSGCMILGEVLCIEIADEVVVEGNRVSLELLDPIGRLSGDEYCGTGDRFSLARPTPQELSRPGRQ